MTDTNERNEKRASKRKQGISSTAKKQKVKHESHNKCLFPGQSSWEFVYGRVLKMIGYVENVLDTSVPSPELEQAERDAKSGIQLRDNKLMYYDVNLGLDIRAPSEDVTNKNIRDPTNTDRVYPEHNSS